MPEHVRRVVAAAHRRDDPRHPFVPQLQLHAGTGAPRAALPRSGAAGRRRRQGRRDAPRPGRRADAARRDDGEADAKARIPLISMSMGPLGAVTRMVGGVFGSALSFAVGAGSSAPGQMPIADLSAVYDVIRREHEGKLRQSRQHDIESLPDRARGQRQDIRPEVDCGADRGIPATHPTRCRGGYPHRRGERSSWRRWTARSSRPRCRPIAQSLGESTLDLTRQHHGLPGRDGGVRARPPAGQATASARATSSPRPSRVFTLASLLCGTQLLRSGRSSPRALLQGAAAAFMSPVGRLIVLRETPKHRIIDAIGLIVWPGLIAPVIGPPLGGFITTYASWRWIFLHQHPARTHRRAISCCGSCRSTRGARTARFDALGFVLTAAALATLIHGLSLVGDTASGAWCPAARSSRFGLALRIRRRAARAAPSGADARSRRRRRSHVRASARVTAGFAARIAISMTPFLLPLMFQIGFGASPFEAGIMLLVYMAGNLAMKSVTTPLLHRFGFRDVDPRERHALRRCRSSRAGCCRRRVPIAPSSTACCSWPA